MRRPGTISPSPGRGKRRSTRTLVTRANLDSNPSNLGFSYRVTREGSVRISRAGREVTTLGASAAAKFLARAEQAPPEEIQQLCARATGNYKRGNESAASEVRGTKGRKVP